MANYEPASDHSIAIVEDDETFAIMLAYNIEALGFSTRWIGNGLEVMAALRSHLPQALVLDWMIPGMSGLSVLRNLRSTQATRKLPILVIADSADPRDRTLAIAAGADAYVAKPFALPTFIEKISLLVDPQRATQSERVISPTYGQRTDLLPTQSEAGRNAFERAQQPRQ
jgi:DNA-binding response OmpR family regulator